MAFERKRAKIFLPEYMDRILEDEAILNTSMNQYDPVENLLITCRASLRYQVKVAAANAGLNMGQYIRRTLYEASVETIGRSLYAKTIIPAIDDEDNNS